MGPYVGSNQTVENTTEMAGENATENATEMAADNTRIVFFIVLELFLLLHLAASLYLMRKHGKSKSIYFYHYQSLWNH